MRNWRQSRHHAHAGFTLIELLVTITVLVIMATWAVPSYQQFVARNEVAVEVMRIRTALALARNTAIARRTTVTVCPSTNQLNCTFGAEGEAEKDWLAPLIVFEGEGVAGDEVLRMFGSSFVAGITYSRSSRPIRYEALGRSAGSNGTFRICGRDGEGAKVIVSNFGRVRIEPERPQC